jgi:hypothetical protein
MSQIGYALIAVLLAALLPIALILTREELRKVRFRIVDELSTTLFKDHPDLPQLKLVSARYAAPGARSGDAAGLPAGRPREALVRIWTGALIYFAISLIGFLLLVMPRTGVISEVPDFPSVTFALLWTMDGEEAELARTLTVIGIAFLGGYVFQLRYLIRATLNQELGALAFVRASLQIFQGMIVALIAYRFIGATMGGDDLGRGFAGAIGLSFVFGLFPNLGLIKIAKYARVRAKTVDEDALGVSKVIPLEVIEGIDAETAFRLEESHLFDVQNLAAVNPIELYAESPFGLLELFDWVLQAQLCVNVGAAAFARLKHHKVRTIFDLERAVLAQGAPTAYVRALGSVIFHDASPEFRRRVGLPPDPVAPPAENVEIDADVVRHAVAIMADDLHIHRLRALWRLMIETTAGIRKGDSPWLYATTPLPGDPDFVPGGLSPPAEAFIQLAAHLGRAYAARKDANADPAVLAAIREECLTAVGQAIAADGGARDRLRLLWDPAHPDKSDLATDLEVFHQDPDLRKLLDEPA